MLVVACADGNLHFWDFSDSCSRPASELHATHAKVTTIEFLSSGAAASTARMQLLAVGDETGTLHVFEVPRSLTRPVPREEQLMAAFFEREQQRNDYMQHIPEIEDPAAAAAAAAAMAGFSAPKSSVAAAPSAPPTAAKPSGDVAVAEGEVDEGTKAAREALKKEEDEFLKMEAAFIAELGLSYEALPDSIKASHPPPKEEAKK